MGFCGPIRFFRVVFFFSKYFFSPRKYFSELHETLILLEKEDLRNL